MLVWISAPLVVVLLFFLFFCAVVCFCVLLCASLCAFCGWVLGLGAWGPGGHEVPGAFGALASLGLGSLGACALGALGPGGLGVPVALGALGSWG